MKGGHPARAEIRKFRRWQRRRRVRTLAVIGLAGVLYLMVNSLGIRHHARHDFSSVRLYELSPVTLDLLRRLDQPLDVTLLMGINHENYSEIDNLLKEYEAVNPLIRFRRVDPEWEKGIASELMRSHNLIEEPQVVFLCGDRVKVVRLQDMVHSTLDQPEEPDRSPDQVIEHHLRPGNLMSIFHGEQAFSSAINEVTSTETSTVLFLQGNGERNPDDFGELTGYSAIARRLEAENVRIGLLFAGERDELGPADCRLLVVAGPRRRIAQPDRELIDRYLQQKGKLLVLLDSETETGLEGLLLKWGVQVGDDVVVEPDLHDRKAVPVSTYLRHPVTEGLERLTTVFYRPRSVRPAEGADESLRPQILVESSARSWADVDYQGGEVPEKDPERDLAGPVPLAVAVEQGLAEGTTVEPTRIVVIGDSDFAVNAMDSAGSEQLLVRSVNWLLNRRYLVSAPGKPVHLMRLDLAAEKRQQLLFLVMGGMPAGVGLLGTLVWMRRRM